jgi:hypothetical protein
MKRDEGLVVVAVRINGDAWFKGVEKALVDAADSDSSTTKRAFRSSLILKGLLT